MSNMFVRFAGAGLIAVFVAQPALGETLFKIVTVKDEVVVGLNDAELGGDAGGIAKAIASKGSLSVWQYGQKHAAGGEREMRRSQKLACLPTTPCGSSPSSSRSRYCPMNKTTIRAVTRPTF